MDNVYELDLLVFAAGYYLYSLNYESMKICKQTNDLNKYELQAL